MLVKTAELCSFFLNKKKEKNQQHASKATDEKNDNSIS